MHIVEIVVALSIFLIGLCALEYYTRNSRLPYVCWVVLSGLGYGMLSKNLIPSLPPLEKLLSPDIVLYVFLPLLIFDSSRKLNLKESKEVALPSFLLATLGIVLNMFIMGGIIYGIAILIHAKIGWMDTLLLSAIMSATDPVAVSTVFQVFPIPQKLKMLIEGESLLNDGTTVILFMLLSKIVLKHQPFHLANAIGSFIIAILGAILIGILFAAIGSFLLYQWKALDDRFIAPMIPILFTYLSFILAQAQFDISGVVAAMTTTLTFRIIYRRMRPDKKPSKSSQERYLGLWDFLGDISNVFLFFILGVEMGILFGQIAHWVILSGVLALVIARATTVYTFGVLFKPTKMRLPMPWQHVLNIGGLRGALCAALVLLIPHDYPFRTAFLSAALGMSLFTLIINPLVMRAYLKHINSNKK